MTLSMRILVPLAVAALLPAAAAPIVAQPAAQSGSAAPFVIAETGQGFPRLDAAVSTILNGQSGSIVIAPGVYRECTVQASGRIAFKAREPGTVVFDGVACEGKAAFVLRGEGASVDGIIFRNIRVADGNGAGIRNEIADLTVTNAMFLDSQEGILGSTENPIRITIDRSTFAGLGQCDETPDCAHSIYLGTPGQITVTRSRFERGRGGHYVKLRAANVRITDNSFDDTQGSKTNYMIDLPEGGRGLIAGNTFVQGTRKENWSGMIVVAAEAKTFPSDGLTIQGNTATLARGQEKSPAFVANASGQRVQMSDNKVGPGIKPYEAR